MSPTALQPRLLTARDVADYLSVSANTVRRMVERGELPAPIRLGGVVRWDRAAIDNALDRRAGHGGRFADPDEALREAGL